MYADLQHELGEDPIFRVEYPDELAAKALIAISQAPADIDALIAEVEMYRMAVYQALLVAAQAYQQGAPQLDAPRLRENHRRLYGALRELHRKSI